MGKAKKLRSGSHKKQVPPTGGPTLAEMEAAANADYSTLAPADAQMFKGLSDLQGAVREAACVAIATMFGDAADAAQERRDRAKLQQMLDAGLLKKLLPRLVDPLPMVRLHALGAMRNISVTGGLDVCERLVEQNVITPLARVIADGATDAALDASDLQVVHILEQAIAVLANVCESCQGAINELAQAKLLPAVMKLAERARAHPALHLETLKLLLLVTDGNPRLSDEVGGNAQYQAILGDILQHRSVSTIAKLYAVGVAMNLRAVMEVDANVTRLLPLIESALAYDAAGVLQLAQEASDNWELSQKSILEDENVDDDALSPEEKQQILDAQTKLRAWKDSVHVLTLALEHVAQLAAGGDDNEEEEEWGSDDEEAMEEYAASHMEAEDGQLSGSPASKALASSHIFPRCVAILQGVVSVPPLSARTIASDFERIRVRVCNAVNNLVQSVSWEAMGEDTVPQIFQNLCTLFASLSRESAAVVQQRRERFEAHAEEDELEVAVTAAMWSALRRAAAQDRRLPIDAEHAQLIMRAATQARAVDARMNAIGMMGCVGQRSSDASENAAIGRCLLSTLDDPSLEVVAQALDAVFDVYGGEDFDDTFRSLQLLAALERTAGAMRSKLRAERRQMDRALVAHVKETQLNLARFIKYKKRHL